VSASSSLAVNALLWTAALAASIWILVPAIAFALNIGGLRTDILPDAGPPTLYPEDSVFGPRLGELDALGFQMEARTRSRGRFSSPIHWSWESYEALQWLVSGDGLTHATLYRLAAGEPARISVVTAFEDGGFVRTSCPGAAAKEATRPNYRRFDLLGVDAATLLAKHQEQVEAFARERGTRPRAATVAEIAAADNAAEWPIVRKMSVSLYGMLGLFLPAVFFLSLRARTSAGISIAPLAICAMAGFYALMRWQLLGPLLRQTAKLAHTKDLSEATAPVRPNDVAEDGRILATGKYERWLRLLAALAAVLSCAWPVAIVRAILRALKEQPGAIIFGLVFVWTSVSTVLELAGRARGRMVWRRMDPAFMWTSMATMSVIFGTWLKWNGGTFHRFLLVVAGLTILLGLIGRQLEKKRGQ
jgi:hypothetical protein